MPLKLTAPVVALGLCGASAIATGVYFHVTKTSIDAGTVQDATTPNPPESGPEVVSDSESENIGVTPQSGEEVPAAPSVQARNGDAEKGATDTSTQATVITEDSEESGSQASTKRNEVSTTSDPSDETPDGSSDQKQQAIDTTASNPSSDISTPSPGGTQASGTSEPEETGTPKEEDTTGQKQKAPSGTETDQSVDESSPNSKGDESKQESSGEDSSQNLDSGTDSPSANNPSSGTPQQSS